MQLPVVPGWDSQLQVRNEDLPLRPEIPEAENDSGFEAQKDLSTGSLSFTIPLRVPSDKEMEWNMGLVWM